MAEIIVALDTSVDEAGALVNSIGARWYKVGLELIYADGGLDFARGLLATGHNVFLDAKLSDIPTTVERATKRICAEIAPHFLSVHRNVEAALSGCSGRTQIVHVPSFTSDARSEVVATPAPVIVCRGSLAPAYRARGLTVIVPGIRPIGAATDDHAETCASADADYLVVGRHITRAPDPARVFAEMQQQ